MLLVIQAVTRSDDLQPYSSGFEAVLYLYAAGALIAYMLADHIITRDEMWAVGATFTLVAWAFAYIYVVVQAVEPGSFTAAVKPDADRTWVELLYLSFTTLTSVGLSDIVPVKPFARGVVDDRAAGRHRLRRDPGLPAHRPDDPPRDAGGELDVVDLAEDLADRGLGVAEQHRRLLLVEQRVVDAREAR